jgi:DNA polymerase-3 subunit alpha
VAPQRAAQIFDLMEKFAEYGFNRSHSAAYALLSWQTAWLKTHHPAAFMAAVLTSEMDDTDKLLLLKRETENIGLSVLPPHVNYSGYPFEVAGPRAIRYGLGAIKGLGRAAAEHITAERTGHGEFTGLHDFCQRCGGQRLNRRAIEALLKAGALDGFAVNRASLWAALDRALGGAEQDARSRDSGQEDLFGAVARSPDVQAALPVVDDWGVNRLLEAERESLGLYLSGHPFDQYRKDAGGRAWGKISEVIAVPPPAPGTEYRATREAALAGLVTNLRKRPGRITAEIDDGTGVIEISIFPETYERCRNALGSNSIVVVGGQLRWDSFIDGWRLAAQKIVEIDREIENLASGLRIRWISGPQSRVDAGKLRRALEPFRPGRCRVLLEYAGVEAQARVELGEEWSVRPSRELRERLSELVGQNGFRFDYDGSPSLH